MKEKEKQYLLKIAKSCVYDSNCLNFVTGEISVCYNDTSLNDNEIMVNNYLDMKDEVINMIYDDMKVEILLMSMKFLLNI